LDVESLNIKHGKYCWSLLLELSLIGFDGNYFDAFSFAALAVLLKYRHKVVLDIGNSLKIYEESEKQRKPFTLNQIPVLFTFAVFNKDILDPTSEGDCFILDPTVR
jgi:exosome complex RNA-binding protein Rrp42 (RNase PH superfamily)